MSARTCRGSVPDRVRSSVVPLLAVVLAVTGVLLAPATATADDPDPTYGRRGPSFPDMRTMAAGGEHSCGVTKAGSLWCWGRNTWGQVGNGKRSGESSAPVQVGDDYKWREVAAGGATTCAIKTTGNLFCWGLNNRGQLGDGTRELNLRPQRVDGSDWKQVDLGWYHVCGIRGEGALYCWGDNAFGELGQGNRTQTLRRKRVPGEWRTIGVDGWTTCGIKTNGSLWCWGRNILGNVGDGTYADRVKPVRVGGDATWSEVDLSWTHACARRTGGTVWCWGRNDRGGVGDGSRLTRNRPTKVLGGHVARSVTTFEGGACLVDTKGALWCWGDNRYSTVGGKAEIVTKPRQRSGYFQAVSGGWMHVCGVGSTGVCWGANERSQLGIAGRYGRIPHRTEPSPRRAPVRAAPYTFRIATMNVLGEHHTGAYRHDDRFAPSRMRAEWTVQAILNNKLDVVGIQEGSEGQVQAIIRASNGRLDAFPNPPDDPQSTESTLLWDKTEFEAVKTTVIRTMFIRRELPRPVVKLRHLATGRTFWVMAIHNAGWDMQRQRDVAVREQLDRIKELEAKGHKVFYIGDFNEKRTILCKVLRQTDMNSPAGGYINKDGDCVDPRQRMRVDWIFGSKVVDWSAFVHSKSPMIRLSTDHWVPMSTVRVP